MRCRCGLSIEPEGPWSCRNVQASNREPRTRLCVMNKKLILPACMMLLLPAFAAERDSTFDVSEHTPRWTLERSYWDRLLAEQQSGAPVRIGRTDFNLSGPVIDSLRPRRRAPDEQATPARKFLNLPVVRLFVPQRLPSPPESGGRYFAWGESALPWTATVSGGAPGGAFATPVRHEPGHGLVVIGR